MYVADTYNDRIRRFADGQVTTLAGARSRAMLTAWRRTRFFDTPCGFAVKRTGSLRADTGNNLIRKLTKEGQVVTIYISAPGGASRKRSTRQ